MSKLTKAQRALYLAAQHCQGGHSAAGMAIAEELGVPFPIRMTGLIASLRAHGENPVTFYPWMVRAHGVVYGAEKGKHPYFTEAELAAGRAALAPTEGGEVNSSAVAENTDARFCETATETPETSGKEG